MESVSSSNSTPVVHCVRFVSDANGTEATRKVLVKYYLDRPGYDLSHSSARLWDAPPATCTAEDIAEFLDLQGIKLMDDMSTLVEIHLDRFKTFMLLESCKTSKIVFDFSGTSSVEPGVLNIRLTDLVSGGEQVNEERSGGFSICNTSPVGLFVFSLTVIMETADLFGKLVPGTVDPSFVLTWGPYAFWSSGLLQLIVGILEVFRNNVYGATAFMAFGSFWLANGTKLILKAYFPEQIPDHFLGSDAVGGFIRNLYIFGFACVLFKQTLTMNKLSSTLIGLLMILMLSTSIAGWSLAFQWIQLIAGTAVSLWAFFAFTCEFTNEVYHREVFNLYPWTKPSSDKEFGQVFAAAGRWNTLYNHAVALRSAGPFQTTTPHALRMALPAVEKDKQNPKSQ